MGTLSHGLYVFEKLLASMKNTQKHSRMLFLSRL